MKTKEIIKYSVLGLLLVFYLFYGIDKCGLFDEDEAYYSEVAREMVETGNIFVPQFNYLPFLHKPVLYYWFAGISYKILGVTEFASRMPSVVFMFLLFGITYYFSRKLFDKSIGIMAAVILATNVEAIVVGKAATMDTLMVLTMTCAIFSFMTAYFNNKKKYYLWFYVFSALATLTKGPFGIVIPFMIVVTFLTICKDLRKVKEMQLLKGLGIFLLISLPWYIIVSVATNGYFIKDFFLYHNITRFSSSFEGHSGNVFYYFFVILFGFFPWSGFLPAGIFRMIQRDKKTLLIFLWAVIPFIFFTIAQTKLPNYIFPVFVPISIMVANWWNSYFKTERYYKKEISLALLLLSVVAFSFGILFGLNEQLINIARTNFSNPFLSEHVSLGIPAILLSVFLVIYTGSIYFCFKIKRKVEAFIVIVSGMFIFNFIFSGYVMPAGWKIMQGPITDLTLEAKSNMKDNDTLIVYALQQPSVVFYSRHKTVFLSEEEKYRFECILLNNQTIGVKTFVLTQKRLVDNLLSYDVNIRKESGGYILLEN